MKYYCPNRNPHANHLQIIAKPRTCQYCNQRVIYWKCSCGAKVHFDPLDEGKYGDHRISCPETYGVNPYKKRYLREIKKISEWNFEKEFLDIIEDYKIIKNTGLTLQQLDKIYYCATCANTRLVDNTVISRNKRQYIWCQCGKEVILTIPVFGEYQLNYIQDKIRRGKQIILNYTNSLYDEIPVLIYFGSYIAPLLGSEDLMDFMFINYIYQRNLDKINSPQENKYQIFLHQMIGL